MIDPDALRVDALVAGRPGFRIGPLSLTAAAGSFTALIGPNGGGKTTLLKTLAGLLPPLAGAIAIGAREARATIAYLPAPGSLSVALPIVHVVALGRAARRGWAWSLGDADRRAAHAALARLGIDDLAARSFDAVSSGQQQLVLMARLLLQDATLCLLDEPTAMLDPPNAAAVERAVAVLQSDGRVVIAATHHLALAARADQVVSVEPNLRVGKPEEQLSGPALSALYGSRVDLCPCCHEPMSLVTAA